MQLLSLRSSLLVAAITATLVVPQFQSPAMDIMERVITTQTEAIRYEATEYQRKVAEANARAYMAAQRKTSSTKTARKDQSPAKPTAKTKLPRYVAVDTAKDKRAAPGTKKVVMIWDTQSEALVGNNVYDVQNVPAVGSTAKFETYSAQYVGNGL